MHFEIDNVSVFNLNTFDSNSPLGVQIADMWWLSSINTVYVAIIISGEGRALKGNGLLIFSYVLERLHAFQQPLSKAYKLHLEHCIT